MVVKDAETVIEPYVDGKSSREIHVRERMRQIVAPLIIAGLLALIGVAVMLLGFSARQVAVVANCLSVILLLPAVLVCFVPMVIMLALTFGMALGYGKVGSLLASLMNVAMRVHILTLRASHIISRPLIGFNRRFAGMEAAVQRIRNKPSSEPRIPMKDKLT